MGISAEERPRLAALTADVAAVLFEATPTPEMVAAANAAVAEIDTFFEAQVEARRARPGDDLISTMVQVADGSDDVTEYELLANVHFMYGAGYEETHCFIASGIFHLLTNPDLVTRLRTDDDGGAAVQQELLRYDTPLQSTLRTVREACEVNGQALAAGQSLQLLLGSANRDELAFPDPDRLIVIVRPSPASPALAAATTIARDTPWPAWSAWRCSRSWCDARFTSESRPRRSPGGPGTSTGACSRFRFRPPDE